MDKQISQMNKNELTEILIEQYGYTKEDLKDEKGKPYTNATLKSMIMQEERDNESLENEELVEPMLDMEVKDDEMIAVMSGVSGDFIHRSARTGRMWKFARFGQTDKMPFIEIMNIYNVNPKCLEDGRLIILDKRVAKNFNLEDLNSRVVYPKDLDGLILNSSVEQIEETVKNLPSATKYTYFSRARELYLQGKIDSISVRNTIEKLFGTSFEDNAPISEYAIKKD